MERLNFTRNTLNPLPFIKWLLFELSRIRDEFGDWTFRGGSIDWLSLLDMALEADCDKPARAVPYRELFRTSAVPADESVGRLALEMDLSMDGFRIDSELVRLLPAGEPD